MAPRGRGGGSSSGSSSSSSSSCGDEYPCVTDFRFVYGNRATSVYSEAELYGQLVVYAIWAVVLLALLIKKWATKGRAWLLESTMLALMSSFAFLCTRYGLLIANSSPPIAYRFEASIVDLLWKLGLVLLFATIIHYTKAWAPLRIAFWAGWVVFTALSLAYVILSFIVSNDALNHFKEDWRWYFSDRDFGQTYSASQIERLKTNGSVGLAFSYLQSVIWDIFGDAYLNHRDIEIKLGLAADVVAFLLAVGLILPSALAWVKNKAHGLSSTILALIATLGLILATLFQLIITAAFILPNWRVITSGGQWRQWSDENEDTASGDVLEGFLNNYRTTVNGFPVVQAVILPFGIIVACIAMTFYARSEREAEHHVRDDEGRKADHEVAPPYEYYPVAKA